MKIYILLFINTVTRFFTALVLTFALLVTVTSYFPDHDTMEFSSIHVIKIFIAACIFGIITVIRIGLEKNKRMLNLSFIQKRWIFFPIYLTALLIFIYSYDMIDPFGFQEIVICSVFFFVIAGIMTAIAEKKYKDSKQKLTESVTQYKNKIKGE